MSNKDESEPQSFKVNDSRRFSADGSPLGNEAGAAGVEAAASQAKAEAEPAAPQPEFAADFSSFILSLAAGAQSGLGIAPHPMSGKLQKDLSQAKYSIDLLGLLQAKTQGNLTSEEAQLLEALLYDLRMRYVEAQNSKP